MGRSAPASLLETVRANSFRKGLLGGARLWLAVFIARFALRWLARVTKRAEMPVEYSERLAVGESLVIRHVDPT